MGIYYEMRFKELVLDVKNEPDVKLWLESSVATRWENVPSAFKLKYTAWRLLNAFTPNLARHCKDNGDGTITLDICIGYNDDDYFFKMLNFLKSFIVSGDIYLYNEYDVHKVAPVDKEVYDEPYIIAADLYEGLDREKVYVLEKMENPDNAIIDIEGLYLHDGLK